MEEEVSWTDPVWFSDIRLWEQEVKTSSRLWCCDRLSSIMTHDRQQSLWLDSGVSNPGMRVESLPSISLAAAGPTLVMACRLFCILCGSVSCMLYSDASSSYCYSQQSSLCVSHISHCLVYLFYIVVSYYLFL